MLANVLLELGLLKIVCPAVRRHIRHPMWKKLQSSMHLINALSKTMFQREKQRKIANAVQASVKSFIDHATARCIDYQGHAIQSNRTTGQMKSSAPPMTPLSPSQKQGLQLKIPVPTAPLAASAAMSEQSLVMMMAKFEGHFSRLHKRLDEQAAQIQELKIHLADGSVPRRTATRQSSDRLLLA